MKTISEVDGENEKEKSKVDEQDGHKEQKEEMSGRSGGSRGRCNGRRMRERGLEGQDKRRHELRYTFANLRARKG